VVTQAQPDYMAISKEAILKWFKHQSDSLDDPFISDLMDEFGAFGYLAWFGLMELIAKENGKVLTGKASFSEAFLRRKLRKSSTKVQLFLNYCSTKGKLSFNFSEKNFNIEMDNLLYLKDNHTTNLQVTCKKVSPNKIKDKDKDKDKNPLNPPTRGKAKTKLVDQKKQAPKKTKPRNTSVPDEFLITKDLRDWAIKNGITVNLESATEHFLDHHRARDSKFVNWVAAWRTWMRNTLTFNRNQQHRNPKYPNHSGPVN
jgi:hypothetical protein